MKILYYYYVQNFFREKSLKNIKNILINILICIYYFKWKIQKIVLLMYKDTKYLINFLFLFFIRILLQDIITGYRGKLRLLSTPPDRTITDMNSAILNIK